MNHYLSLIYHIFNYRLSRFFNKPFSFPINLTLSVTNICYSRCKTCNVWKIHKKYPDRSKKELKLEEWEKILRSIGKTPIWVTVTGGETMLRADLPDIINHVEKYNKPKYINIATSGIYPEKTLKNIKTILSKLDRKIKLKINISVDEINDNYKNIRGLNAFKNVENTFFKLKKIQKDYPNLIIGVNIVISKYNHKRIGPILDYITTNWNPDSIVSEIGEVRKAIFFKKDLSVSDEEYLESIDYLTRILNKTNALKPTKYLRKKYYQLLKKNLIFKNNNLKCYSGYASCEISSHGELWDCAVNARSFGNLRKNNYDFKKVWNSRKAKKIRENIKTTKCFCNTANPNYTNILCDFRVF